MRKLEQKISGFYFAAYVIGLVALAAAVVAQLDILISRGVLP